MPGKRQREETDSSEVIALIEQKIPCRTEQMRLLSMVIAQVKFAQCWFNESNRDMRNVQNLSNVTQHIHCFLHLLYLYI